MATAIINQQPETLFSAVDGPFKSSLRPDPDLTVDQWADEYRVLSRVSAGEPGRWRTSRTPFLLEIMRCLSPSSPYSRVIFVKPAQIGGSEVLLNMLGYIIHYAPGSVMLVEPTVEPAKRFSRQRIVPLIENTTWRRNFRAACWWRPVPTGPWACGRCGTVPVDGRSGCLSAVDIHRRRGHGGRGPGGPGDPAHGDVQSSFCSMIVFSLLDRLHHARTFQKRPHNARA